MTFRKLSFVSKSRRETHIVLAGLRMSMYHVQCIRMSLPYFVPPWTMKQYEPVNIEIRGLWAERSCSMLFDVVRSFCGFFCGSRFIKVCHLRSPQSMAMTSELRHGQQKDTNSFPLAYAGLDSRWLPMVSVWTSVHIGASCCIIDQHLLERSFDASWWLLLYAVLPVRCKLLLQWQADAAFCFSRLWVEHQSCSTVQTLVKSMKSGWQIPRHRLQRCVRNWDLGEMSMRHNLSVWWVEDSRSGHNNWDGKGRTVEHGWTW